MQGTLPDLALEPELRRCFGEVMRITQAVEDLVRNLTDAQLGWKPRSGVWSIAQCLEHLALTACADLPCIPRAASEGRSSRLLGHGPFRYGVFGRLLTLISQ